MMHDCVAQPLTIWNTFKAEMAADYQLEGFDDVHASDLALEFLADHLSNAGRSLLDFGLPTPISPSSSSPAVRNELRRYQLQHNILSNRLQDILYKLNEQQRFAFDSIVDHALAGQPLNLYIDGKAGTGKTTLLTAVCDWLRSDNKIVLATATSAFAAQLYPGGSTTHSMFKVFCTILL